MAKQYLLPNRYVMGFKIASGVLLAFCRKMASLLGEYFTGLF